MKKIIISIILVCVLVWTLTSPAFAYNYDFSSGGETLSDFGKSTSSDEPVSFDPMSENIRRNKDAAYLPPPYFYGSGNIPTDPSSLYHDNTPGNMSNNHIEITDTVTYNYPDSVSSGGISYTFELPPAPNNDLSTSIIALNTEPLYYSDGSIGTIYVERTGKTIKVYEGEQLDNLKMGAGHFATTSTWDGNVAMCGHNRGEWPYFGFFKDLQIGDKIVYTTQYGTRTYEVFSKEQINEYDYSKLGWSAQNLLTLITCVQGISELRWAAILREAR